MGRRRWHRLAGLLVVAALSAGCTAGQRHVGAAAASSESPRSSGSPAGMTAALTAAATEPGDAGPPDPACDASFARLVPRSVPSDLHALPVAAQGKPALQERVRLYSSDPAHPATASRSLLITLWCPAAAGRAHPAFADLSYTNVTVGGHPAKRWRAGRMGAGIDWTLADGSAIEVASFESVAGGHSHLLSDAELVAVANSLP